MKTEYIKYRKRSNLNLEIFSDYLNNRGFSRSTIIQHLNYVAEFLSFIKIKNVSLNSCSYMDIMEYIEVLKSNYSSNCINRKLCSIRYYYRFKELLNNPVKGVRLRGKRNKLIYGLLTENELENVYNSYEVYDVRTKRNKVILSLLTKQGIRSSELNRISISDLDLNLGRINVGNRTLALEANQILELYEYITMYRPKIKGAFMTSKLLLSINGCHDIKSSLEHLFRFLHRQNSSIISPSQLRRSIISHWLKKKDILRVKYMAGHKCISSTNRYRESNIEDLKTSINFFRLW